MNQPANLMPIVINVLSDVDHSTIRLTNGNKFFDNYPSLKLPDFSHPELGMLRSVSWFYAMYHELGKPNVKFIVERFDVYGLDSSGRARQHPTDVQKLRTLFQHNLDPSSDSDEGTRQYCNNWFRRACKVTYPDREDEWLLSLTCLLQDVIDFLKSIDNCMRKIEEDESIEEILSQWEFRRQRYHPQYEFDRLIGTVALDLGRSGINAKNFSNRYYPNWLKELEIMENYEFETEARRLIERAILEDIQPRLPLDGNDIMREFNWEPGRRVGDAIKMAIELYNPDPCSKDELIQRLRNKLEV